MFHQVENINKGTEIMKLSQKEFGEWKSIWWKEKFTRIAQ
jgi:hypothetical protein